MDSVLQRQCIFSLIYVGLCSLKIIIDCRDCILEHEGLRSVMMPFFFFHRPWCVLSVCFASL